MHPDNAIRIETLEQDIADRESLLRAAGKRIEALEARNSSLVEQCNTHAQQKMAAKNRIEVLENALRRLRSNVEYWRLAAERREARNERSGIDVAEARTLDTPSVSLEQEKSHD